MKNNSFVVKGFLKEVSPTKQLNTTSVREFVVETEEDYPQPLPFELFKDNVSLLDNLPIGQSLNVHFSQRGRAHNGRTYVSNRAWKLEVLSGGKAVAASDATPQNAPAKSTEAAQPSKEEKPF